MEGAAFGLVKLRHPFQAMFWSRWETWDEICFVFISSFGSLVSLSTVVEAQT